MGRRGCPHRCFGGRGIPAGPTSRVSMRRPQDKEKEREPLGGRRGVPTPRSRPVRGAAARRIGSQDSERRLCPRVTDAPGHLIEKPKFRIWSLVTQSKLGSTARVGSLRGPAQAGQKRGPKKTTKLGVPSTQTCAHKVTHRPGIPRANSRGQKGNQSTSQKRSCCAKASKSLPTPRAERTGVKTHLACDLSAACTALHTPPGFYSFPDAQTSTQRMISLAPRHPRAPPCNHDSCPNLQLVSSLPVLENSGSHSPPLLVSREFPGEWQRASRTFSILISRTVSVRRALPGRAPSGRR